MSVVRSLAFYLVFYGLSVAMIIMAVIALVLGEKAFRPIPQWWTRLHHWCVVNLLGITVVTEGRILDEPALYAFKHESFFEAINLPVVLGSPVIFAKQELFSIPIWGRAARTYGVVPVARKDGAKALRAMISAARSYMESGRPLAIFPEGTRVPHGEAPRLRSGFAGLYKMLGVPVVPVAVNSGPVYGGLLKKRGTITLRFGEAIPPGLPRDEVEQRVHRGMNALND